MRIVAPDPSTASITGTVRGKTKTYYPDQVADIPLLTIFNVPKVVGDDKVANHGFVEYAPVVDAAKRHIKVHLTGDPVAMTPGMNVALSEIASESGDHGVTFLKADATTPGFPAVYFNLRDAGIYAFRVQGSFEEDGGEAKGQMDIGFAFNGASEQAERTFSYDVGGGITPWNFDISTGPVVCAGGAFPAGAGVFGAINFTIDQNALKLVSYDVEIVRLA